MPIGESTKKMKELKAGDAFMDFVGPLGQPSEFCSEDIEELKKKRIVFVAGGVGTAPVYPQLKWLHEHGITADAIVGAKTKDLVILEKEMSAVSNLYITTDDGSYVRKGMGTDVLRDLVQNQGKQYDVCLLYTSPADGPVSGNPAACRAYRLFQAVFPHLPCRGSYGNLRWKKPRMQYGTAYLP